jgi:hypothetical protein
MPFGLPKPAAGKIRDLHRRVYLGDALYRLDYWRARTFGAFRPSDLAGPGIANPFGVLVEGTLVEAGAEYRHYCAHKVATLLDSGPATVAEIGGGFGGMAYYLLRDRPGVRYIDFDVPESLAVTAWYLGTAFPRLSVLLFGEAALGPEAIERADVVLMPLGELPAMREECVDVTYSSHALSDIAPGAAGAYRRDIVHMTRSSFLYVGSRGTGRLLSGATAGGHEGLELVETVPSGWNDHIFPDAGDVEWLFRKVGSRSATT